MTSDAKIGLLLGLVFIFIIAFIINGLPSFRKDANNNELTTDMAGSQNNSLGLATKERKVSREVINQSIRFRAPLPKSASAVKETVEVKSVIPAQSLPAVKKKETHKVKPSKPTLPKVYVVGEGDNLAVIAQKFYGSEDGNKRINITRIFEANRKFLKSSDEIYVGQKLIIPPLSASHRNKSKIDSLLASPMLEKVESIGKRHFSADSRKAKQSKRHVVREGDSLWQIAAEQLGDGNRYGEIAKLNADILDDEDSLSVGMRLEMPAR